MYDNTQNEFDDGIDGPMIITSAAKSAAKTEIGAKIGAKSRRELKSGTVISSLFKSLVFLLTEVISKLSHSNMIGMYSTLTHCIRLDV